MIWLRARSSTLVLMVLGALFLPACGSIPIPPPGSSSEEDVIAQGREADKQIEAQFGFYENDALNQYVDGLGDRIAAISEWPSLPWNFRILDSPVVNAFAVPGGYVYVTRGLLAHVNSESELAGVLGHEIGHITSRHAAEQQRRATLVSLGLLLGGAFVPEFGRYGLQTGLAQTAAGLFLLKYSRDQENEADQRGVRYAILAGYDPRGIGSFFETLQRIESAEDGHMVPAWASTHPPVEDRIERTSRQAETVLAGRPDRSELVVGRRQYLGRVDDLVYGDNPRHGFTDGSRFLHPDLRFEVDFPAEWRVMNSRQAVQALSPREDATVLLTIAQRREGESPDAYVRRFLDDIGARVIATDSARINGLPARRAVFEASSQNVVYRVEGAWIEHRGLLYELLGISTPQRFPAYEGAFSSTLTSFDELQDRRALAAQPARLDVVSAPRSMPLADLVADRRVTVPPETIALINSTALSARVERSALVKLVVGGVNGLGR